MPAPVVARRRGDPRPEWDAVILAGGRASRLGGIDKPHLRFDGTTLLAHALTATAGATQVCIVGHAAPDAASDPRVTTTQEVPRWGGPASALAAGLSELARRRARAARPSAEWIAVLASDLPRVVDAVPALWRAAARTEASGMVLADGVQARDPDGRRQPLLALYRADPLYAAIAAAETLDGGSVTRLLAPLSVFLVPMAAELCQDVDTPDDARRVGIVLDAVHPVRVSAAAGR